MEDPLKDKRAALGKSREGDEDGQESWNIINSKKEALMGRGGGDSGFLGMVAGASFSSEKLPRIPPWQAQRQRPKDVSVLIFRTCKSLLFPTKEALQTGKFRVWRGWGEIIPDYPAGTMSHKHPR